MTAYHRTAVSTGRAEEQVVDCDAVLSRGVEDDELTSLNVGCGDADAGLASVQALKVNQLPEPVRMVVRSYKLLNG